MPYRYVESAAQDGSGCEVAIFDLQATEQIESICFEEGERMRVLMQSTFSPVVETVMRKIFSPPLLIPKKACELRRLQTLFMEEGYRLLAVQNQNVVVAKMLRVSMDDSAAAPPKIVECLRQREDTEKVQCTYENFMVLIKHALSEGMDWYMHRVRETSKGN